MSDNFNLTGIKGNTPVSTPKLDAALVKAQSEFKAVDKDTKNDFFKSKYADLAAVKEAAQPVLAANGLAVTQKPGYLVVADKVYDTLRTEIVHESGERDGSVMILRPAKTDPQGQGSAITYAKRYAFMAVLGLVADVDDDGNAASGVSRPAKAPAKKAAPKAPAKPSDAAAALERVKTESFRAGADFVHVKEYFAAQHGGDVLKSTDAKALNEVADYYAAVANGKEGLGATVVE